MRTIQRIIRRSGLPVKYSKGFNPHMDLSLAQPLSVGVYSEGDYLDVVFDQEVDENEIKEKLNSNCPDGVRFFNVIKVPSAENEKKVPQTMALLDGASYTIKIKYSDGSTLKEQLDKLNQKSDWTILKRSKKGEKMVDIKTMIKEFSTTISENSLIIDCLIDCGSRSNLSADLLSQFVIQNTEGALENSFVDIKRKEMFVLKDSLLEDNLLIPLYDYFK
jgi:radical SAM-linked protein